jgi:hypothetical protein
VIGVIADPREQDVVHEFFELFKTPWEFYRRDGFYEILLCVGDAQFEGNAKLVLCYADRRTHFDDACKIQTGCQRSNPCILSYRGNRIPIYGSTVTFLESGSGLLTDEGSRESVADLDASSERPVARIGYDLFREVRTLLTGGQPSANANLPALDLHIALLRDLITGCGVSLVEIPPVPSGHPFIVCLTHDVDHPSIRQHKWDHTLFGFLYRAIFGSLRNFIRGKTAARDVIRNWVAVLKLPFVHLRLTRDLWSEFDVRYLELEKGLTSTFFVIPFKNDAGKKPNGQAPALRAARYAAQDITDTIQRLIGAGCEVGLHGIDAWLNSSKGREELEEIRRLTGASEIGVRTHWLYHDHHSHSFIEQAGAIYDSTMGYNDTVGYRAGTTQVFRPLGANHLLELPLHVMDTALFYSDYLGLCSREARVILSQIVDNAVQFGGCLTINWHDRSLAPERLWGECYRDVLQDLKNRAPWFSTAGQAVSWFRKRRAAAFEADSHKPGAVRVKVTVDPGGYLPGLRLRIHKTRKLSEIGAADSEDYVDLAVDERVDVGFMPEVAR